MKYAWLILVGILVITLTMVSLPLLWTLVGSVVSGTNLTAYFGSSQVLNIAPVLLIVVFAVGAFCYWRWFHSGSNQG